MENHRDIGLGTGIGQRVICVHLIPGAWQNVENLQIEKKRRTGGVRRPAYVSNPIN